MSQICSCVVCGHCFEYKNLKTIDKKIFNIKINEKVCPFCGSTQWESLAQGEFLDRYLNFADKALN